MVSQESDPIWRVQERELEVHKKMSRRSPEISYGTHSQNFHSLSPFNTNHGSKTVTIDYSNCPSALGKVQLVGYVFTAHRGRGLMRGFSAVLLLLIEQLCDFWINSSSKLCDAR